MIDPVLSIVVGTVDRPAHIAKCIESVVQHTTVPWELIVTDASREPLVLEKPDERIRVIREAPRLGHAKGYNRAFREARGKWVCWLNDDAEATPGWASSAVQFMESAPWCGLGCFYHSENGCCYHLNEYQGFIYANFGILSKEFGDELCWFDECVNMYGADNSITFKTLLSGRGVSGIPGGKLMHRPIWDAVREQNVAGQIEDARKLMDKYRDFLWAMERTMYRFPPSPLRIA